MNNQKDVVEVQTKTVVVKQKMNHKILKVKKILIKLINK